MSPSRRFLTLLVAASVGLAPMLPTAQAGVIPTEQLGAATTTKADGRARLMSQLERADVVAALQARGVDVQAARARVAALTDAEADEFAAQIDGAPAGGDVLGVVVFIFVLLLVTDILGFTKVFPFTRSIRR
jgi:hypothetical protein